MLRTRISNNHGAALVFIAIVLLVLLSMAALAIDLGQLYVAKQRAQNVADAAALAGGRFINGTADCKAAATTAAEQNATSNNSSLSFNGTNHWLAVHPDTGSPGVKVTFPTTFEKDDGTPVIVSEGSAIRVDVKVPVSFGFARIMGFPSSSVPAHAIAMIEEEDSVSKLLFPCAGTDTELLNEDRSPKLTPGQMLDLKVNSWQDRPIGPGNFGPVSFNDDTGEPPFLSRLAGTNEDDIIIEEGMWIDTLPGNRVNPQNTYNALETRIGNDTWTFDEWRNSYDPVTGTFPDTTRLVLVPIIDAGKKLNGKEQVLVVGFAAFFLEGITADEDGKLTSITGTFFQALTIGEAINWDPFGTFKDDDPNLLDTVKLVA